MTNDKPKFSILIPTWNNLEFLKLCVESIETCSTYEHEILIHVNDGSDGTLDWVKSKGLKYTYSKENIGVCWALNTLRRLVTTDYIVFVNDDMYMLPEWDKVFYQEIERIGHKYFFLSATTIQKYNDRKRKYLIIEADYGSTPETFRKEELLDSFREYEGVDWLGSTAPPNIVHRDIWDLVGGYSIEFSLGMTSDQDFSAKLWLAGVRYFRGLADCRCYHFMSKTVERIRLNFGPLQFLRKYGITKRTFELYMLHQSQTVANEHDTESQLRRSRWIYQIKKLFFIWYDAREKKLWEATPYVPEQER